MNRSLVSLSLSLLALPFTFYVPKGVEKRQRFKPKGKGVTEITFFFFVRFEMNEVGLLGCPDLEYLESRRKKEGTRGEREEIGKLG